MQSINVIRLLKKCSHDHLYHSLAHHPFPIPHPPSSNIPLHPLPHPMLPHQYPLQLFLKLQRTFYKSVAFNVYLYHYVYKCTSTTARVHVRAQIMFTPFPSLVAAYTHNLSQLRLLLARYELVTLPTSCQSGFTMSAMVNSAHIKITDCSRNY